MWGALIAFVALILAAPTRGAARSLSSLAGYGYTEGRMYPQAHPYPFPASSPYRLSPVSTQRRLVGGTWEDEFGRSYGGGTPSIIEAVEAGASISGVPGLRELATLVSQVGGLWNQLSQSPLWDIAVTGAYALPGGGPLVSAGLRMAVELGRGASLEDAAIASAREALPPGPARAAFDVAVGASSLSAEAKLYARGYVEDELGPVGVAAFDEGMRRYG